MKHLVLLYRMCLGVLWALLVGFVSGYLVMREEYDDAFKAWGSK